ncbi:hypothetical protein [Aureibacter tunicatorum]|uniref:Uncharacterized protein n=1 Tax=Aureibacter tunicatorum TaxID=866807 RepID=A0AAE3XT40_9BACT|nr:hypothetical protein [Aureibacter tunicatorum]MDR6241381.1 hypothetical protein [Aureibacter tunicatorum]BDD06774.1 hypothetical protein AUTU_42570 [Aureibacter tunicatorum]
MVTIEYDKKANARSSFGSTRRFKNNTPVSCKLPPDIQNLPPIQAQFRPARIKKLTYGHACKASKEPTPVYSIKLSENRTIIIDDEKFLKFHSGEMKGKWYAGFKRGVKEDFWVKEENIELPPPDKSFLQFMRMFEECRTRRFYGEPGYDYSTTYQKYLFSKYVRSSHSKPFHSESDQKKSVHEILEVIKSRPTSNFKLTLKGKKDISLDASKLREIASYEPFLSYFYGLLAQKKDPVSDKKTDIATPSRPFKFDVYLNVKGPYIGELVRRIAPLLDDKEVIGELAVRKLTIAPLRDLHMRPDSLVLRVTTESGLERIKAFISKIGEEHPEYFSNECLRLTEPFSKGASWAEDPWFDNVWDMDDHLLVKVGEFLDMIALDISDHKQKKSFFGWRSGDWNEMEQLHRDLQLQWVRKSGSHQQIDHDKLSKLHHMSLRLSATRLNYQVVEWLEHYQYYKKKYGNKDRLTFLGLRTEALGQIARSFIPNQADALRAFMKIAADLGIDIIHPHRNRSIAPYKEEGMLVIETAPTTSQPFESPAAFDSDMLEFGQTQSDGACASPEAGISTVYMRDIPETTRQILRASKEEKEKLHLNAQAHQQLARQLEEEFDEL